MITGELKRKVDSIWNTIWTGGISSPITVLEQVTYLIFMKLLEEKTDWVCREGSCLINKQPRIETEYRLLRWSIFKHFEPEYLLEHIRTYVFPFIKKLGADKDSAFCRYMKNAVFLIPSANVLHKVMVDIDELDMHNRDLMGDIYEYLLSKIAAAGENGQFRTPRHIINMMVQLMRPTLQDHVLDPAMGSAGFLQGCSTYIQQCQAKELEDSQLSAYYKSKLFSGYDTDPSMLRIGAMNMMLHGVEAPNIRYLNSLSAQNSERNCYSLILANPPFKGKLFKEDISSDLTAVCSTTKSELLFVALFTKMLTPGGRCASIVPEGVLFGGSKAHKALRKELVEHQQLRAIISMPSGVFRPYSGVSTAIIIFTKTDSGGTNDVWFYEMQADGFSLDDKRSPIDRCDIADIISRFENISAEHSRKRTEQSFLVPKQEIVDNEYDLNIKKYKKTITETIDYPPISEILSDIEQMEKQIQTELADLREMLKNEF